MRTNLTFCLALASLAAACSTAAAGCFSGPSESSDSSYAYFEFTNNCGTGADVPWTLQHEGGRVTKGSWHISRCSTERKQGFKGTYTIGSPIVDESLSCLTKEEAAKREPEGSVKAKAASGTTSNGSATKTLGGADEDARLEAAKRRSANYTERARAGEKDLRVQTETIKADEKRVQQQAERIKEQAKEQEDLRTKRDLEEANRYLCFSHRHNSGHVCTEVCKTLWNMSALQNYHSWNTCRRDCLRSEGATDHLCVPIDQSQRDRVLREIRKRFEYQFSLRLPSR